MDPTETKMGSDEDSLSEGSEETNAEPRQSKKRGFPFARSQSEDNILIKRRALDRCDSSHSEASGGEDFEGNELSVQSDNSTDYDIEPDIEDGEESQTDEELPDGSIEDESSEIEASSQSECSLASVEGAEYQSDEPASDYDDEKDIVQSTTADLGDYNETPYGNNDEEDTSSESSDDDIAADEEKIEDSLEPSEEDDEDNFDGTDGDGDD